jgi:hypothetical protein
MPLQDGTEQLQDVRGQLEAAVALQVQAQAQEAALTQEALASEQLLQQQQAELAELRGQALQLAEVRQQHSELQAAALTVSKLETTQQVSKGGYLVRCASEPYFHELAPPSRQRGGWGASLMRLGTAVPCK